MPCTKETVKSAGLNIWSSDPDAGVEVDVDIIAVQGLGADPFYTWVKPPESLLPKRYKLNLPGHRRGERAPREVQEDVSQEVMWLRDLLVPKFQNARVGTYSYKSDWRDRTIKTSLDECAVQFLNILHLHRQKPVEHGRRIVLIGHSLGGLVVQQALVNAALDPNFSDISESIRGIIFLGTPFQGSDAAVYGELIARMTDLDATLLKMLQKDNPELHILSRQFWSSHSHLDIVCFYENRESKIWKKKLVSTQSAVLPGKRMIFLDADHSGLNKFSGIEDENFALLLPELERMVNIQSSVLDQNNGAQSRYSSKSSKNTHWNIPRQVNGLFMGRADILTKMQRALHPAQSVGIQKRFVITGLGGQGKSEICLKVAENMRESFWGVFWVDVDTPSTASSGFMSIARALEKPAKSVEDVCNILANTKQTWLLILDNADDPHFDYQLYFPSGNFGSVIMTSRNPICGSQFSNVGCEELHSLNHDHAVALLLKASRIPEDKWAACQPTATNIIDILGSHTLALIQAGAYIAKKHERLDQYPEIFQLQRKRLLKVRPVQASSRYRDVYATFEASAELLSKSEHDAEKDALCLLGVLSMLHFGSLELGIFSGVGKAALDASSSPDDVSDVSSWHVSRLPEFISVEDGEWDDYRLIEAVSILESFSLVFRNEIGEGVSTISMHPLVHAWARDRHEPREQCQAWISTGCILALHLSWISPKPMYERYFRPHLQSYLDIMSVKRAFSLWPKFEVLAIYLHCSWGLIIMRDDHRLDHLLQDIFIELDVDSDKPTKDYMLLFKLRVGCLENLSSYGEAISLCQKVLEIEEARLDNGSSAILTVQRNLAINYLHNNQISEAISLFKQVVRIQQDTLSKDHPSRLVSEHGLASAYLKNNQISEAISLFKQVVRIQQDTLSKDHPSRLVSEHELANAYLKNNQISEAISLFKKVLRIQQDTLSKDHPSRLVSEHGLASAYLKNNQISEAISLFKKVLRIQQDTLSKDHPSRLASEHGLASAYLENNQISEAISLFKQVVRIRQDKLSKDHPDRLTSEHELANAYLKNNQISEAISLFKQVVRIRQDTLSKDHPDRLASEHRLAVAYLQNNQISEAISLFKQVVRIQKTLFPEDHQARLLTEHDLAIAYYQDDQIEKALALMEHVVQIKAKTLDDDDPGRLNSVEWLELIREKIEETEGDK